MDFVFQEKGSEFLTRVETQNLYGLLEAEESAFVSNSGIGDIFPALVDDLLGVAAHLLFL